MSRLLYLRRTGAAFFLGCWGAAPKKFVKSSDTSGIWFCTLIFAFNEMKIMIRMMMIIMMMIMPLTAEISDGDNDKNKDNNDDNK